MTAVAGMLATFDKQLAAGTPISREQAAAAGRFVFAFVKFLHHHHHNEDGGRLQPDQISVSALFHRPSAFYPLASHNGNWLHASECHAAPGLLSPTCSSPTPLQPFPVPT